MDWINFSKSEDGRLSLDFSLAEPNDLTGLEASIIAVENIVKNYPGPYTLFASGGVDSQAMIWAWLKSGYKFNVVSFEYEDNFNQHDVSTLKQWADINKVEVEFRPFQVMNFLSNMEKYVLEYECTSPHICTHMAFSETVPEGTVVYSGEPIKIKYRSCVLNYTILGLYRYMKKKRKNMIPFFFIQDPVQCYGFSNTIPENNPDSYMSKCEFYKANGFPVIPQLTKLSGFEIIKDFCDEHYSHLITKEIKFRHRNQPSKRTFDLLYRYKWLEKIQYTESLKYVFK